MIIWLVGLSGSGKTTIGKELYKNINKNKNKSTIILDGDEIRKFFDLNTKYDQNSRLQNARRIQSICKLCNKYKINVVCNIVCIFPKILKENKKIFSNYFEVYLKNDLENLKKKDKKNVYKKKKNVVGVDIKFPIPEKPSLTINTQIEKNKKKNAKLIYELIKKKLI